MADAPAPVRVSPLIKFGRWSFLVVGVLYGASHRRSLAKREEKVREIEEKQRVVREAKLAEEKSRLAKQELVDLAKMAGVPPEA
ncbi:hypothetical protein R5R35_014287 [Gryllus longicercus]|uniref:ATP synthase F(0) complex subunit e, mitochondrial n=1 Tax=Gryllus longicercus TaxID=2509291 RepID=A0AAN9VYV4_9ORTH